MLYKLAHIERQFRAIHPEVRKALQDIERQLLEWDLPEITITQVLRTPQEQEDIYFSRYLASEGSEARARSKAREQFSWHLVGAAADFRSTKYTASQRKRILKFLKENYNAAQWEVLLHDAGHGSHYHLARRDPAWRHPPSTS